MLSYFLPPAKIAPVVQIRLAAFFSSQELNLIHLFRFGPLIFIHSEAAIESLFEF